MLARVASSLNHWTSTYYMQLYLLQFYFVRLRTVYSMRSFYLLPFGWTDRSDQITSDQKWEYIAFGESRMKRCARDWLQSKNVCRVSVSEIKSRESQRQTHMHTECIDMVLSNVWGIRSVGPFRISAFSFCIAVTQFLFYSFRSYVCYVFTITTDIHTHTHTRTQKRINTNILYIAVGHVVVNTSNVFNHIRSSSSTAYAVQPADTPSVSWFWLKSTLLLCIFILNYIIFPGSTRVIGIDRGREKDRHFTACAASFSFIASNILCHTIIFIYMTYLYIRRHRVQP